MYANYGYTDKHGDLFSLGSMVQKGKFSAAAEAFVSTLKKVDFLQKAINTRQYQTKTSVRLEGIC